MLSESKVTSSKLEANKDRLARAEIRVNFDGVVEPTCLDVKPGSKVKYRAICNVPPAGPLGQAELHGFDVEVWISVIKPESDPARNKYEYAVFVKDPRGVELARGKGNGYFKSWIADAKTLVKKSCGIPLNVIKS